MHVVLTGHFLYGVVLQMLVFSAATFIFNKNNLFQLITFFFFFFLNTRYGFCNLKVGKVICSSFGICPEFLKVGNGIQHLYVPICLQINYCKSEGLNGANCIELSLVSIYATAHQTHIKPHLRTK